MKKKAERITGLLRKEYPDSRVALSFETPFQLLVATMLSAQSTDKKVNEITPGLFRKYPSARDFANAPLEDLENRIRPCGFYRNKAKNISGAAKIICSEHGGSVPESMEALVRLPGVARKTANIVLSGAFKKAEGIAVDTHVARIARRLGLTENSNPDKIERDLMLTVPPAVWLDFNHILVTHGRRVCTARKPACPDCVISGDCVYFDRLSRGEG